MTSTLGYKRHGAVHLSPPSLSDQLHGETPQPTKELRPLPTAQRVTLEVNPLGLAKLSKRPQQKPPAKWLPDRDPRESGEVTNTQCLNLYVWVEIDTRF